MFRKIHLTTPFFLGILVLGLGISSLLASVPQEEKVITTDEYLSYLNSIAPSDTDHLYELKMGEGAHQILRLGTPGEYYYLAPLEQKKKSLLLVSLVMSQFYCDWKNREASAFSNEVTIEQDPISEREKSNLREDSQVLLPYPRSTHYDPLLSSNIIINVISQLQEDLAIPQNEEISWDSWEIGGTILLGLVAFGGASSCSHPVREREIRDDSIPYTRNDRHITFGNNEEIIHTNSHFLKGEDKIPILKNQLDVSDSEDEEMLHVFKNQLFSRQMYLDREDIDDQDLFNESSANIRVLENLLSPEIHHKFFNGIVDSRTIQEIQDLMASHQKIIEWTEDISIDDLSINQQTRNLKKLTDSTKKILDTKMGIQIHSIRVVAASCVSDLMDHEVKKATREIFYQSYYDLISKRYNHAHTNFDRLKQLYYFCQEHQILPLKELQQLGEHANANSALCNKVVKNLEELSFNREELQEQDRWLAQETDEIHAIINEIKKKEISPNSMIELEKITAPLLEIKSFSEDPHTNPLTRIFHTDRDEEAAKADGARRVMKSDDGCMSTYCPRKTSSSTQHLSDFPAFVVDQYEICGLTRIFHTDRDEEATKADGAPPAVGKRRGDCQRLSLSSPERARRAEVSESTQRSSSERIDEESILDDELR
ncbi:MAG: hypothetical protein DVB29_04375 [Verrucomicrobia bacterium]|nr:MAG: hypothetical protein DVB29_04375 [Verrucomicrobiota bacterium]